MIFAGNSGTTSTTLICIESLSAPSWPTTITLSPICTSSGLAGAFFHILVSEFSFMVKARSPYLVRMVAVELSVSADVIVPS